MLLQEWRNGRRESFKSFSFFLMVQVRNLSSVQMDFIFSFYFASATEAWHSTPLISIHLPFIGAIFSLNNWLQAVAIAVLILRGNHSSNHSRALSLNSGFSGFRKSVSLFWNTQTLERVHLKWRQRMARSYSFSDRQRNNNRTIRLSSTNRLPSAWRRNSLSSGKTTVVWLSVLFFLLAVCNAFGLVPLLSAITGRAGFTLGQSIALLSAITYSGIRRQGIRFVRLFQPSGPSWPMAPLFIQLESISYCFRAISQGTRLYCNMFRGHLLLHLFTSQSLVPVQALPLQAGAPVSVFAATILMALSALETIVAVLQSGVFCLLRTFYQNEVQSKKDKQASASPPLRSGPLRSKRRSRSATEITYIFIFYEFVAQWQSNELLTRRLWVQIPSGS